MHLELFPPVSGKGEQARQKLLMAALKVIGDKGYESASVRDIAVEAGQNVASISYYFGGKEKLYVEVLRGIGDYLRSLMGPVFEETHVRLDAGTLDPASATEALKRAIKLMLGHQLEGTEFSKIRLVMVREQAAPSEAFGILYQESLRPLHETFCRLLAVAIQEDAKSIEVVLRAHAVFGQVLVFTVARATILQRLGITNFEPRHVTLIAAILDQHLDRLCGAGPYAPLPS